MVAPVIKLIDATSPDAIKIWADKIYAGFKELEAMITQIQVSSGGTPAGPAGGVLGGTYPDPSFAVDMATQAELNAVAATAIQSGDAAGGDLSGTYPNPNVVGIHSGATPLAIGAITDTQFLIRSGSTVTSTTIAAAGGALWDEKYVVSRASTDLSDEIVIPGMAANADIAGYLGAGTSEEYDTTTTGLTWTPSTPDTVNSNTSRLSHLYMKSIDTVERLGTKPWAPSGAFEVFTKLSLGTEITTPVTISMVISDSGNSNRVLAMWACDFGNLRFQVQCHSYAGGSYTTRGPQINFYMQNHIYLRLVRNASNLITLFFSTDGIAWVRQAAPFSFTFTPDKIGFRTDSICEAWVDFLRTDV